MAPRRVQLRRTKGWRKPPETVVVVRPSPWGNPFVVGTDWMMWAAVGLGFKGHRAGQREAAVVLHRAWVTGQPVEARRFGEGGGELEFSNGSSVSFSDHCQGIALLATTLYEPPVLPERPDLGPLRGRDLACWCPLSEPCHADVLLELANR